MKYKYVVIPGYIRSKYDNQNYYVSSKSLIALYGVDPEDCLIYTEEDYEKRKHMDQLKNLKVLRPRFDRDYSFLAGAQWQAEQIEEIVEIANSILTLTHPKLSNVEMNTLTTRQYMLWQQALKKYRGEE